MYIYIYERRFRAWFSTTDIFANGKKKKKRKPYLIASNRFRRPFNRTGFDPTFTIVPFPFGSRTLDPVQYIIFRICETARPIKSIVPLLPPPVVANFRFTYKTTNVAGLTGQRSGIRITDGAFRMSFAVGRHSGCCPLRKYTARIKRRERTKRLSSRTLHRRPNKMARVQGTFTTHTYIYYSYGRM